MLSSESIVTDIFGASLNIDINDDESFNQAASHAILCPKNTDVDILNSQVMDRMPAEYKTYLSNDLLLQMEMMILSITLQSF